MKTLVGFLSIIVLAACASAPRGPSDAELRAQVEGDLHQAVSAVQDGNVDAFAEHFAPDAAMSLHGVEGPDGVINRDITGVDNIRGFLRNAGTPPNFEMTPTGFSRQGNDAVLTGTWSIANQQTGTFSLTYRQLSPDSWKIVTWRFDGQ